MMKVKTVIVFMLSILQAGCWEYADGEKVGTIIKMERSGLLCKTWEATMVRGGFTDGSGVAGTTISHFTIEDGRDVMTVRVFMEAQTPVRVRYREEVVSFCRSDSANVFLTSIESGKP